MRTYAIITAAGQGKRMGRPKQFIELGAKTILERTLSVFEQSKIIDGIVLVVNQEQLKKTKKFKFKKLIKIVAGGKERQDSVSNGLKALPEDCEIVVIHDGARPFVSLEIIRNAVVEAKKLGAVVVGVPVKDTIKQITNDKLQMTNGRAIIKETLDRDCLWAAQTPQVFKKEVILKAYAAGIHTLVTDDAMLVEKLGIPVKMVMGSYENIKITTPADLKIARGMIGE